MPPAYLVDDAGRPMHSWRVLLLPFIEQQDLYSRYDFSQSWNSPHNIALADEMPKMYAFAGEHYKGLTTTNYLAVVGDQTAWPGADGRQFREITDERDLTILVVENQGASVHWMEPRDLNFNTMSFQVNDPEGVGSVFDQPAVSTADGGVFEIPETADKEIVRGMLTVDGGEKIAEMIDRKLKLLPNGR